MIETKNKFFDSSKLSEVELPSFTTPTLSYTDIFQETPIEIVSGKKERKKYRLK